jgi:crotonobetainyl-CoA:carnitine CoA-transferase CaiB-like acyl-CoA transferase
MVVIGGNGDSIFKRLMIAIGRDDLGADPGNWPQRRARRARGRDRRRHPPGLQARRVAEVLAVLNAASVPAGRIYTAADIAGDPHFQARGMILNSHDPRWPDRCRCRASCPSCRARRAPSRAAPPSWARTPRRCCRGYSPEVSLGGQLWVQP